MEQRIIKFRAWDGEQMVSPDYIDRKGLACWKENSIPTTSKDVMQFTGLKDKNGKEIYEGDILKMEQQTIEVGAIEFVNGGFWIKGKDNFFLPAEHLCEIIGNIHSNPELLTIQP